MIFSLFSLVNTAIVVLISMFIFNCINEKKYRAVLLSSIAFSLFLGSWLMFKIIWMPPDWVLIVRSLVFITIAILWFSKIGSISAVKINNISERFDERDTVFAREEYKPGTPKYEQYYSKHPEHQTSDDKLRKMPELLSPGGKYYDADKARGIKDTFGEIKKMTTSVDGEVVSVKVENEKRESTAELKQLVIKLGADEVGIANLNPMYVYSHVGRGPEPWGEPILNNHKHAIIFTLEMDYFKVDAAPDMPTVEETAKQYLRAAEISIELAKQIRSMGYPARAHISDSNYQIILPAVANDAGLGELGRCGFLISEKHGARVRLGGVTTDLPLIPDTPKIFGVQEFCKQCLKCVDNCPPRAIPAGGKTNIRGVEKWQLDSYKCIHYWRIVGTDCGRCMKVCPFSHPPSFVHNLVRAGIKRSAFARKLAIWGDDILYGRKAKLPKGTER